MFSAKYFKWRSSIYNLEFYLMCATKDNAVLHEIKANSEMQCSKYGRCPKSLFCLCFYLENDCHYRSVSPLKAKWNWKDVPFLFKFQFCCVSNCWLLRQLIIGYLDKSNVLFRNTLYKRVIADSTKMWWLHSSQPGLLWHCTCCGQMCRIGTSDLALISKSL